jgi:hypothetical protein
VCGLCVIICKLDRVVLELGLKKKNEELEVGRSLCVHQDG